MGILARIDDYFYERRERRKREFILKMEAVAENHRICQEIKSAAFREMARRHREKVESGKAQNKA